MYILHKHTHTYIYIYVYKYVLPKLTPKVQGMQSNDHSPIIARDIENSGGPRHTKETQDVAIYIYIYIYICTGMCKRMYI